jgi:hypothetical protein
MTRRERFRKYMASVDPASNPLTAIEQGFYVDPPGAISKQIVARLEIEPTARQLVVGSIGSGKTTQLLVARDELNKVPDISALYADVSESLDLSKLRAGWLVAAALDALVASDPTTDDDLRARVRAWVVGYQPEGWEYEPGDDDWSPGILARSTPWPGIDQVHVDDLQTLAKGCLSRGKHPVFLFDGLDRLGAAQLGRFAEIVEQDVAALHSCGVGVVLVGPIRSLAGFGRLEADRFDYPHEQAPLDVRSAGAGREFFERVLRQRADESLLPPVPLGMLVDGSGGVLRDLMALAKLAGEEAYLDGADAIDESTAASAVHRFGKSLLIGLGPDEIGTLRQVRETGRLVEVSPSDVALIATRRVLVYRNGVGTHVVHPAIAPLLDDVGGGR